MSVRTLVSSHRLSFTRAIGLIVIAVGVTLLQVTLPRISIRCAGEMGDNTWARIIPQPARIFLRGRLRFQWIRSPRSIAKTPKAFLSAAICKQDLYILLGDESDRAEVTPTEIVRVNLLAGSLTSSLASQNVRHILSDGKKLWWLPEADTKQNPNLANVPFLLQGSPALIVNNGKRIFPVLVFDDGGWRDKGWYAKLPVSAYAGNLEGTVAQSGGLWFFRYEQGHAYYGSQVGIGTRPEAEEFAARYFHKPASLQTDNLKSVGWARVWANPQAAEQFRRQFFCHEWWFDRGLLCFMSTASTRGDHIRQFQHFRFLRTGSLETTTVRSPIRWDTLAWPIAPSSSWTKVVATADGQAFVIYHNGEDGRLHILKWEQDALKLISHRGGSMPFWVLMDAGVFTVFAVLIPTLILGLIAWFDERRRPPSVISFGHESVIVATIARRGLAKLVDVSIPVTLLLLSVVLHPDVMGWWLETSDKINTVMSAIDALHHDPIWSSFSQVQQALPELALSLCTAPCVAFYAVLALATLVVQIVWQSRNGRTAGKWLLGVRVVQTNLRHCGLSRTLLREILLIVDSLFLVMWIPGVISIMATRQSQRIGDLIADTIVIRDGNTFPSSQSKKA